MGRGGRMIGRRSEWTGVVELDPVSGGEDHGQRLLPELQSTAV